jgi:hypothetical protein
MADNYDDDWVFNFDCAPPPMNIAPYYDNLIIPLVFYNAVKERNVQKVQMVIKHNINLSLRIVSFFDISLKGSFFYKLNSKFNTPVKIPWNTKSSKPIILNFNEQCELYKYIVNTQSLSNMGFLINTINSYLVQLRTAITYINNKMPANYFFKLGLNVHNNPEMKVWVAKFIPRTNY